MSNGSFVERFARGVFWNLIGTAASRLITMAIAVVTARLLGKAGFGELAMIQSTIGLLGTFFGYGLGLTTTKYVAELKEKDPDRAGRIIALTHLVALIFAGLMALVCLASAPWLAQETMNAPQLAGELKIGAAVIFFSILFGVQTGTLSGFQAFRTIARINFLQSLFSVPLALVLIYFWGLKGAVIFLAASTLIGVLFSSQALACEYSLAGLKPSSRGSWVWAERRVLWKFSLPATLSCAMVPPVVWAANAILVNQPNGYAELGLFNVANQFRMIIMLIPNILGMVTMPLLSEIHGQNDREFFARAVNLNLRTVWSMGLALGFLVIGISPWLMDLFGSEFQGGRAILLVIVCVAVLDLANYTIGHVLVGAGRMWVGFLMNLGRALFLLPCAAFLTPSMGAMGLALAYLIAYFFHTLWVMLYTAWKFGFEGVKYVPSLVGLTLILFIFTFAIQQIPEVLSVVLSLCFGMIIGLWAWWLLPAFYREKILGMAGAIT